MLAPEPDDALQFLEQSARIRRVEVDRINVLVLFGRVLGVFDAAVGSMMKPLRMLTDPRMVRRTLNCEIQRHLYPKTIGGRVEVIEIVQRADRRIDRNMPSSLISDRPRASRRTRSTIESVARTLAIRVTDRMYRRQVYNVKTEVAQFRQAALGVLEGAGLSRIASLRSHKHLIPGSKASSLAIDDEFEQRLNPGRAKSLPDAASRSGNLCIANHRERGFSVVGLSQSCSRTFEHVAIGAPRSRGH